MVRKMLEPFFWYSFMQVDIVGTISEILFYLYKKITECERAKAFRIVNGQALNVIKLLFGSGFVHIF